MKAMLLLLVVLTTTILLPARVSAQDEPRPSVLKSVGVTAAEVGGGLVISLIGEYGYGASQVNLPYQPAVPYIILAATPASAAAGVYGIGTWLDRGGSFGPTVLGSYIGAAVGIAAGLANYFAIGIDMENDALLLLVAAPVGCAVGSVIGYKLSRRHAVEEETRWQLIPPSMGLALRRPASGGPMEIAGVRVNLAGARF
jgi:hypothetical protein